MSSRGTSGGSHQLLLFAFSEIFVKNEFILSKQPLLCAFKRSSSTRARLFLKHDDIQMVAGKLEEEWRGTAIAHTDDLWHTRAKLLKAGLSCVLHDDNIRFVVASGHLPHHSTVPEAKAILDSWLCFRSSRLGHEGHASDQSLRL